MLEKIKDFFRRLNWIIEHPVYAYKVGKNAKRFIDEKKKFLRDFVDSFIKNLYYTVLKAKEGNK